MNRKPQRKERKSNEHPHSAAGSRPGRSLHVRRSDHDHLALLQAAQAVHEPDRSHRGFRHARHSRLAHDRTLLGRRSERLAPLGRRLRALRGSGRAQVLEARSLPQARARRRRQQRSEASERRQDRRQEVILLYGEALNKRLSIHLQTNI